jgi:hypothetical protein
MGKYGGSVSRSGYGPDMRVDNYSEWDRTSSQPNYYRYPHESPANCVDCLRNSHGRWNGNRYADQSNDLKRHCTDIYFWGDAGRRLDLLGGEKVRPMSFATSPHFSHKLCGSFQPGLPRSGTAQVRRDSVAQALVVSVANHQPVWFELRLIDASQAEACATQGVHTPQRDSAQQADIAEQICHALVRYRG